MQVSIITGLDGLKLCCGESRRRLAIFHVRIIIGVRVLIARWHIREITRVLSALYERSALGVKTTGGSEREQTNEGRIKRGKPRHDVDCGATGVD